MVDPSSLLAQVVQKSALDALLPGLSLKTARTVSSMPLRGAGQKIKVQLDPPTLKVNGVAGGVTLPVDVTVELSGWAVKRGTTQLTEGTDYKTVATDAATRTFVFKTRPFHWTTDPPPAGDALTVLATVKLKAGAPTIVESNPKSLSLPMSVPRLGIPKLLALYRNTKFQEWKDGNQGDANEGFMLIMVPSNSPLPTKLGSLQILPIDAVTGILGDLKTATDNLSQLAVGAGDFNFAGSSWVLGLFLGEVTPYNESRRRVRIGGHDDFGEIEMLDRTFNDVEANDEISSVIFLADKGNRAYLFNDIDYDTSPEGWFTLEAGEGEGMVVRVPSLVGSSPNSDPAGRLDVKRSDETFNNKLSSVRFTEP
jgi:hypothetical protein